MDSESGERSGLLKDAANFPTKKKFLSYLQPGGIQTSRGEPLPMVFIGFNSFLPYFNNLQWNISYS